jgi:DHA3 family macrolide efflux protein-like MFS transporter
VLRRPTFVYLLWRGGVVNGLWVLALWICLPLIVQRQHLAAFGLEGIGVVGLVMGCYGGGNIAGNLLVSGLQVRRPVAMVLAGNLVVGLGLLAMAIACSSAPAAGVVPLLMLAAAATAVGGPLSDIPMATLRQTAFAPHEVAAVHRLTIVSDWSGILAATALGPLFLAHGSPAFVMALCAGGILATVLAGQLRYDAVELPAAAGS